MVAGTASRLAMETDDGLLWPLTRAAAEEAEAAWRQAASWWSSDASEELRTRSTGGQSGALSEALVLGVVSGALLGTGTFAIASSVCVCCCCCCLSTASAGSAGAASGLLLGWPLALSVGLLFWRWTRLPGAARPLSLRLSCWDAAFFLPFATIEGGARASGRSPQVDSTAAQDEPVWKRGAAGGGWNNGRRVVCGCASVVRAESAREAAVEERIEGSPDVCAAWRDRTSTRTLLVHVLDNLPTSDNDALTRDLAMQ